MPSSNPYDDRPELDAHEKHNKNAWSYFMRFGIFMSMLGLVLMVRATDGMPWLVTADRDPTVAAAPAPTEPAVGDDIDLMSARPQRPGTVAGTALGGYGNADTAEFGMLEFCLRYQVTNYANQSVKVCWGYFDTVTLRGETKDACMFMENVNLCDTVGRARLAMFVSLVLIAVADVFSEKSAICSAVFVIAVVAIVWNIIIWTNFMAAFKEQGDVPLDWGTGLTSYILGGCCVMAAAVTNIVAFYCWDFDDHDKCLCGCLQYLYESADDDDDEKHNSALSRRQQFYKDGVGVYGRIGAFLGLLVWTLLLICASHHDWLSVNPVEVSASISGFNQLDGGAKLGLGDEYQVMKRGVNTVGGELTNIVAYNKFSYDQVVNILRQNGTTVQQMQPLIEAFEDQGVEFERLHRMTGNLLIAGITAAFIGDIYSEFTVINGLLCFLSFAASAAACFFSFELLSQADEVAKNFLTRGLGLDLIMVATGLSLLAFLLNMVDARVYGVFKQGAKNQP